MDFLDLITTANHNLFRNKTRTFLTILAVFIGSFTIILNSAINAGVNDFIDKQVESIGGDGYIEVSPKALYDQMTALLSGTIEEYDSTNGKTTDTSYFSDTVLEKLRAIDGVNSLNPYNQVSLEYITSPKTDKKYKANFTISPDDSLTYDMVSGRQVDSDSDDYEIMLTEDYVDKLGFASVEDAVGQTVILATPVTAKCYFVSNRSDCLKTIEAKVTGVQAPGVMSSGGLRGNIALNDRLYELASEGLDDSSKLAYMATGNIDPAKIDSIRQAFEDEGFSILTVDDEVGMIRTFFDVILVVFNIFGIIALIAAAIGIVNTLFMSVQERTREIGLMKALGMSRGKIFFSFSFEAILLGFWGSAFGIAVSMIIGQLANRVATSTFLSDFPTFELTKFEPSTMLTITLIIMFIAFIAGTLPARQASKKDPIDALRYE